MLPHLARREAVILRLSAERRLGCLDEIERAQASARSGGGRSRFDRFLVASRYWKAEPATRGQGSCVAFSFCGKRNEPGRSVRAREPLARIPPHGGLSHQQSGRW